MGTLDVLGALRLEDALTQRALTLDTLEALAQTRQVDPFSLAKQTMDVREALWSSGGAAWVKLPGDAGEWSALPPRGGHQIREAMQTEDDDEDADRSEEYSDDGRVSG